MKRLIKKLIALALVVIGFLLLYRLAPGFFSRFRKPAQELQFQATEILKDLSSVRSLPESGNGEEEQASDLCGPYAVDYVIDGDTAFINIDGESVKVRFLGIDTPESVHQDESRNTPEGKIASDYTKKLLTGKSVYLEYDVQREDEYGRTLAYLYLDDGVTMVQEEILRAGMATTLTIQPNSKYADELYAVLVEAREAGAGFWATGFYD